MLLLLLKHPGYHPDNAGQTVHRLSSNSLGLYAHAVGSGFGFLGLSQWNAAAHQELADAAGNVIRQYWRKPVLMLQ